MPPLPRYDRPIGAVGFPGKPGKPGSPRNRTARRQADRPPSASSASRTWGNSGPLRRRLPSGKTSDAMFCGAIHSVPLRSSIYRRAILPAEPDRCREAVGVFEGSISIRTRDGVLVPFSAVREHASLLHLQQMRTPLPGRTTQCSCRLRHRAFPPAMGQVRCPPPIPGVRCRRSTRNAGR